MLRRLRRREERGAVAIMVGILAVMLFVVAALVVDLGLARDTKRQSQNAADASALAGANALYPESLACSDGASSNDGCVADAVDAAVTYAEVNFGITDWAACPTTPPSGFEVADNTYSCITFDSLSRPTKVYAVMPTRDIATGLGALAGVDNIPVSTVARASLEPGVNVECSICVVGDGDHHIGNGDLDVSGQGGVHVNGSLDGTSHNSLVTTDGDPISIEGGVGASSYNPSATSPSTPIEDPWAGLALPPSWSALSAKANPCTGGPGIYGSYEVGNNDTCTLSPGLYVFRGTLSLKNTSELRGSGVTLYFPCSTGTTPRACAAGGEAGGVFDAKNGSVQITAGPGSPVPGYVVVYDRANTSPLTLQGNGTSVLGGNVYALSSLLDANGNSCHTVNGGAIVVDDIYLNGNQSCLNVANGVPASFELPPDDLHLDQ